MIKIHSIETLGALDGPGLRTVIFFQGCGMRCLYCHNPDTFNFSGGNLKSEEELAAFCLRYKSFYGTEGGVTLSGGEPLIQAEGALKLIRLLHSENINVALDTAGGVFAPEVLAQADLTILDIKHSNPEGFKNISSADMTNTLKTLEFLKENKKRFWVRQVIVPGYTDSEEQVLKLKELSRGAEKIELLPYHSMGAHKWENLGLEYKLKEKAPPTVELMKKLNSLLN